MTVEYAVRNLGLFAVRISVRSHFNGSVIYLGGGNYLDVINRFGKYEIKTADIVENVLILFV